MTKVNTNKTRKEQPWGNFRIPRAVLDRWREVNHAREEGLSAQLIHWLFVIKPILLLTCMRHVYTSNHYVFVNGGIFPVNALSNKIKLLVI